ncbi:hypothetical protein [Mesorhizobium sp. M6A.T.Cr.TU.016.01.1.1]|uniref:hypothetical protein n=1 Tax=Mesorhizobium sp. M6A.T.Cr.TU.016.01.1.1 TaxID=2493677 RepID=UPI000F759A5E|nr:hypothetical protein [Mesorhizobium sp. M6A.T.Cr.TU.016.01.1.1]AZO67648.1 hypothetical protein EJ075_23825 [Mesorhizobium sp. M6A.T.Cr.TU.016.01.1.1]
MAAENEAITRTVKLIVGTDRAALVRCSETGREALIPLALVDLAPAGPLHVLTVPADLAREAGLL